MTNNRFKGITTLFIKGGFLLILIMLTLTGCSILGPTPKMNERIFNDWLSTFDTTELFPGITEITYKEYYTEEENEQVIVICDFTADVGNTKINGELEISFKYDEEEGLSYSRCKSTCEAATLDEFTGFWTEKRNQEGFTFSNPSYEDQTIEVLIEGTSYTAKLDSAEFSSYVNKEGSMYYSFIVAERSGENPYELVFLYDVRDEIYSLKSPKGHWFSVTTKGDSRSGTYFKK